MNSKQIVEVNQTKLKQMRITGLEEMGTLVIIASVVGAFTIGFVMGYAILISGALLSLPFWIIFSFTTFIYCLFQDWGEKY